ncbi:porin family protein [Salinimicrobium terrae]|uniref:porin family protein n=1 Tax=Salinimicrobium terrae TaxID=470866 RepID=UPI00040474C4|nr:porin family protein [Salinimicrobium terrae]
MKKLLIIAAVFLSAGTLSAQEFVEFGAKGGLNFASLSGDETEGLDGVTSFHLGLLAEFPLTDKFSVQPEVLYSGLGASASEGDATLKLDYISVPVMLKYYVMNGLFLEAGPQISFNVVAEAEEDGETGEVENIKSTDFGAGVGVGYELPMGLLFDARYVLGFSNIWDGELDGSDFSQKNNVIQLSVGFKF